MGEMGEMGVRVEWESDPHYAHYGVSTIVFVIVLEPAIAVTVTPESRVLTVLVVASTLDMRLGLT